MTASSISDWAADLARLRAERTPVVVVTVAAVRGHAPCAPGAKLLVTPTEAIGTVGGGYLERHAITLARAGLHAPGTRLEVVQLNPRTQPVQCCGGEVTLLIEVLPMLRPSIAIFGVGHVGLALARLLAHAPVELHLIDTRQDFVRPERLGVLLHGDALVRPQHAPILEAAVPALPSGTHLLVMTHDHAEDLAVLDMALRRPDLGFIGLIGSSVKWTHFRTRLLTEGHTDVDLRRITTPIGLGRPSKDPLTIAMSVAAQVLQVLEVGVWDEADPPPASQGGRTRRVLQDRIGAAPDPLPATREPPLKGSL